MRSATEVIPHVYQLPGRGSSAFVLVEESVTVIDTGRRGSGPSILEFVGRVGRSPGDISYIVSTHHHLDHVGGTAHLQKNSPGRVAVHEADVPFVQGDEPHPNPFQNPAAAFLMRPVVALSEPPPFSVEVRLKDGDRLEPMGGMEVVHSPGHTPGSISLYFPREGLLIAGDALQYHRGKLGLPSRLFTVDMALARDSIRRLAQLDFDVLCLSHSPPLTGRASESLRRFAATLD